MASIPEQRVCKQVRDRQLYNMQSSIQIATTRIPALSFFTGQMPFLSLNQPWLLNET